LQFFCSKNSASQINQGNNVQNPFLFSFQIKVPESTTTRKAGGLDFAAIGGKRQGREVPHSLKTTRWNRVRSMTIPLYERDGLDIRP
jgi:hypothetical protein